QFRPLLCPSSDGMLKGMKLLQMFLPTMMTKEEHASFGADLWFEEVWHHFISIQRNSIVEPYQVRLFTRLSRAQSYLTRLMTIIESFLHPSNYGNHSSPLLNLLNRLVNEMVNRI
ncbi:hypothetical protein PMAYCL1PPCAC_28283, partial [Pristionchus mayeri]